MSITLPDNLAERLEHVAQQENLSPQELIEQWLTRHKQEIETPKPGTFAALAKSALDANIGGDKPNNTVENSREILQNEYADYLKSRMNEIH